LSYAIPTFDLTPEEWLAWSRLAASRRPLRALQKIVRGVAEFMGLGKRGPLFEEAFGMSLVRTLRHAMEDHPIIVASKAPLGTAPALEQRTAEINVEMAERAQTGSPIPIRARITNRGSGTWRATARSGTGHVRLGVQLLDGEGRLRVRDYHRVSLPADAQPAGKGTADARAADRTGRRARPPAWPPTG
jgi:hypothetical protein